MDRILAALSGGVDSAVAAAILVQVGHDVVGVSLQLADGRAGHDVSRCCSAADIRDARLVCGSLGIPYYVLNEEEAFSREVLVPFLEAYSSGRTPNPCVRCNSVLKFGSLTRIAKEIGATRVATGHYARLADAPGGGRRILRGRDRVKDQSYFLFELDQEQREMALFPLGEMTKEEVYAEAERLDLPVARKPESQDLCFVPRGDVGAFLARRLGDGEAGEIVDRSGRVLGRHNGVHAFTIGQRRGIGVPSATPLYVIGIDADARKVRVGEEGDQYAVGLVATGCRLHDPALGRSEFRAEARIRSRHLPAPATVTPLADRRLVVRFDEPQRAVTPGQAVVLYQDDLVLGGGWIERSGVDLERESHLAYAESVAGRA